MSAHTPRPWSCSGRKGWYDICGDVSSGSDEKWICEVAGHANARLIAAAPDLLAALKAFTDAFPDLIEYETDAPEVLASLAKQVAAAIAKAEGESP